MTHQVGELEGLAGSELGWAPCYPGASPPEDTVQSLQLAQGSQMDTVTANTKVVSIGQRHEGTGRPQIPQ